MTAVDRGGNESAPSAVVEATTATIEVLTVKKDVTDAKEIRVDIDIPRAGAYIVWLKMNHKETPGQYVKVAFDGKSAQAWTVQLDGMSDSAWHTYGEFGVYNLEAGAHTLTITKDSIPHEITQVLVTNDQSLRPEGHVNLIRGW